MKKILFTLLVGFCFFSIKAQSDFCGTDAELAKFHEQNPLLKIEHQQELLNNIKAVSNFKRNKANGKIIIPLAIHIIHFNGNGDISKTQVEDGIRILNEHFNKLNADTSTIRPIFKPYLADLGIEFRLAKIDPNGNATEGITRTNSHFAMAPNDRNKPKTVIGWDRYSYLNVWLVPVMTAPAAGGTLLGFAQFPAPSQGALSTYGLMVRSDEWGTIEVAQSSDGSTPSHEIGHCLNLLHPFPGVSGCGSLCQGTGDFVCDTPPQFDDLNNSCNRNLNSCSNDASGGNSANPNPYTTDVPDQLENIMGYASGCGVMFTEGQKTRVLSAINTYQKLDSISSDFNEIQTGTNDGYVGPMPKPIVNIMALDKFGCTGDTISFTQNSYGGPLTTFEWTFTGGTPSTSNSPNPSVSYANPGNYDVSLKVTNAAGSDLLLLQNYVHISPTVAKYSAFNYIEDFESPTNFNNDWTIIDEYIAPKLERTTFAAASGSGSLWINNLSSVYSSDQAISPSLDMTAVIGEQIKMDIAYRRKNSSSQDKIAIYASIDCGKTWLSIISMTPSFFAFDNSTQTSNFIASQAAQWKPVTVPGFAIPAAVKSSDNVLFMIEVEYGNGNNIFIDNFRIDGQPVGIETNVVEEHDFYIYPNPSNDLVNVKFNFLKEVELGEIYVQNILGEKVKSLYSGKLNKGEYKFNMDAKSLPSGIYFVTAILDGERITRKLVVN